MSEAGPRPIIETFDTLEQLEAISSPFRLQLLESFQEPATVKEVATALEIPVTRLYYHVNKLIDAGFLAVVEERQVGGLVERRFAVTADGFTPSESFIERYGAEGKVEAAKLIFRSAEAGVEVAAAHGLLDHLEKDQGIFSYSYVRLAPERLEEFLEKLTDLLTEFDDREGDSFWRLVALVPRWAGRSD